MTPAMTSRQLLITHSPLSTLDTPIPSSSTSFDVQAQCVKRKMPFGERGAHKRRMMRDGSYQITEWSGDLQAEQPTHLAAIIANKLAGMVRRRDQKLWGYGAALSKMDDQLHRSAEQLYAAQSDLKNAKETMKLADDLEEARSELAARCEGLTADLQAAQDSSALMEARGDNDELASKLTAAEKRAENAEERVKQAEKREVVLESRWKAQKSNAETIHCLDMAAKESDIEMLKKKLAAMQAEMEAVRNENAILRGPVGQATSSQHIPQLQVQSQAAVQPASPPITPPSSNAGSGHTSSSRSMADSLKRLGSLPSQVSGIALQPSPLASSASTVFPAPPTISQQPSNYSAALTLQEADFTRPNTSPINKVAGTVNGIMSSRWAHLSADDTAEPMSNDYESGDDEAMADAVTDEEESAAEDSDVELSDGGVSEESAAEDSDDELSDGGVSEDENLEEEGDEKESFADETSDDEGFVGDASKKHRLSESQAPAESDAPIVEAPLPEADEDETSEDDSEDEAALKPRSSGRGNPQKHNKKNQSHAPAPARGVRSGGIQKNRTRCARLAATPISHARPAANQASRARPAATQSSRTRPAPTQEARRPAPTAAQIRRGLVSTHANPKLAYLLSQAQDPDGESWKVKSNSQKTYENYIRAYDCNYRKHFTDKEALGALIFNEGETECIYVSDRGPDKMKLFEVKAAYLDPKSRRHVLPCEEGYYDLTKECYAEMCVFAQMPELQIQAAAKTERFSPGQLAALEAKMRTEGILTEIGPEQEERPLVWEDTVNCLAEQPQFLNACKYFLADEARISGAGLWPPAFQEMRCRDGTSFEEPESQMEYTSSLGEEKTWDLSRKLKAEAQVNELDEDFVKGFENFGNDSILDKRLSAGMNGLFGLDHLKKPDTDTATNVAGGNGGSSGTVITVTPDDDEEEL